MVGARIRRADTFVFGRGQQPYCLLYTSFVGALLRRPHRRDLVWLSLGLVLGVVAQAVLGGIVVYTCLLYTSRCV